MVRRTEGGQVMFLGGPSGEMEMWSPEELVLEAALSSRLGDPGGLAPTAKGAADAARKVNGHWASFLAFRKSSIGVGFGGMPSAGGGPGLDHGPVTPNERFSTFTPAQRVQRARERKQFNEK